METQASGRPVIAYAAGGALDTVLAGETGIFFSEQTVDAVCAAVEQLKVARFSPEKITAHAAKFDTQVFKENIAALVDSAADRRSRL